MLDTRGKFELVAPIKVIMVSTVVIASEALEKNRSRDVKKKKRHNFEKRKFAMWGRGEWKAAQKLSYQDLQKHIIKQKVSF